MRQRKEMNKVEQAVKLIKKNIQLLQKRIKPNSRTKEGRWSEMISESFFWMVWGSQSRERNGKRINS